ncbi:FYVE zinc finger domain-containing protein [Pseudomonas sp. LFM046]|uniref:FYVE zinc finger domain-containing protein n=1 Tax=Pseudomonas sp. LFM046 TaxID=1608357 RepID=UPI0005CFE87D|nr:FYVE zinc finger domain-containing protein [Pseudomonas sp. LFM046]
MNWDEYQSAKLKLIGGSSRPILMMSGVMFDNGTRYLEKRKGITRQNTENGLLNDQFDGRDFVWNGRTVQVMGDYESGGHPALAGFDTVHCAGRIMGSYFFFHSGHYHPKQEHAVHFLCDFIDNTCRALAGLPRDAKVDELSKIRLRLYRDNSETDTYWTTFAQIAAGDEPEEPIVFSSSGIKRSAPIKIGGPLYSVQKQEKKPIVESSVPSILETGITAHGRHLKTYRINRTPNWIPDSERTRCAGCNNEFGMFRWKHHCRQCGDIFCDDCSKKKKHLKHPARRDSNDNSEGPHRVCNNCFSSVDLRYMEI